MSQKSEQNPGAFIDTALVVTGLGFLGLVAWNTYQITLLGNAIEANTIHTCWLTEMMLGTPASNAQEACDVLREQIQEYWNR